MLACMQECNAGKRMQVCTHARTHAREHAHVCTYPCTYHAGTHAHIQTQKQTDMNIWTIILFRFCLKTSPYIIHPRNGETGRMQLMFNVNFQRQLYYNNQFVTLLFSNILESRWTWIILDFDVLQNEFSAVVEIHRNLGIKKNHQHSDRILIPKDAGP